MTPEMRGRLLALLASMAEEESWCGETHVQKCAYFLQEGLGVPLGFKFILYKYGPFSFDLREALGELWGDYVVEMKTVPGYGPSIGLTESGRSLRDRLRKHADPYQREIGFVASRLSKRGVMELERLATALLVRGEREGTIQDRARRLVELKPHVSESDARQAVEEVEALLAERVSN